MPPAGVEAGHAGAAADGALGDLAAERGAGAVDVGGGDGARVGQVGVVALPHHRDQGVRRVAALGQLRRRGRPCPGRGCRTGRRRSGWIPHSSISSFLVSSPTPFTVGDPDQGRELRRGDHGDAGELAAGRLGVADEHAGHVGDGVALPASSRRRPTGPARSLQRWLSHRPGPAAVASARVVEQAGRELPVAPRSGSAADRPGRRARSAAGSAGGSGSPAGRRWRRAARPVRSSRLPPPPAAGTGIAVTSACV